MYARHHLLTCPASLGIHCWLHDEASSCDAEATKLERYQHRPIDDGSDEVARLEHLASEAAARLGPELTARLLPRLPAELEAALAKQAELREANEASERKEQTAKSQAAGLRRRALRCRQISAAMGGTQWRQGRTAATLGEPDDSLYLLTGHPVDEDLRRAFQGIIPRAAHLAIEIPPGDPRLDDLRLEYTDSDGIRRARSAWGLA